jgi:hypothetical protein
VTDDADQLLITHDDHWTAHGDRLQLFVDLHDGASERTLRNGTLDAPHLAARIVYRQPYSLAQPSHSIVAYTQVRGVVALTLEGHHQQVVTEIQERLLDGSSARMPPALRQTYRSPLFAKAMQVHTLEVALNLTDLNGSHDRKACAR